jgi:hypothetical protein
LNFVVCIVRSDGVPWIHISVVKFCLIFLVHSLYLPISLRRIAARFSQETIELNSINTGNIERQSLDSSIAESEKKKKGE